MKSNTPSKLHLGYSKATSEHTPSESEWEKQIWAYSRMIKQARDLGDIQGYWGDLIKDIKELLLSLEKEAYMRAVKEIRGWCCENDYNHKILMKFLDKLEKGAK